MAHGNGKTGRRNGTSGSGGVAHDYTVKKKVEFLAAYRECGIIRNAAEVAGISRRTHYNWLKANPQYREDFETATRESVEELEAEARTRATIGALRPVFYKGEAISIPCQEDDLGAFEDPLHPGHFRKLYFESTKSDILLMFLLKKLDPSYREGYVPPRHSRDDSMVGLSHEEAVVKKALLTIDTFNISESAKQELRDRVNAPE
jgi:hypothetical protein